MKKHMIGSFMFAAFLLASLPAFSACHCKINPCHPCMTTYTTAGVVNYEKAKKRTNFGVIAKEKQLNEFEKLIKVSGLKPKVDKGEYTVLAPTNDAIKSMRPGMFEYLKKAENRDALVKFVKAHLVPCENTAQEICCEGNVVNENCCEFCVTTDCGWLKVGKARVIAPNIQTKTGTVHVIDRVIDPYA